MGDEKNFAQEFKEKVERIKEGALDSRNEIASVSIDAFDLSDAWFQCIYRLLEKGYVYPITKGSFEGGYRIEFDDVNIRIRHPESRPIIPIMPEGLGIPAPTDMNYVEEYFRKYLIGEEKTSTEDYTYGERLINPKARLEVILNQEEIKEKTGINLDMFSDDGLKTLYPYTLNVKKANNKITLFRELPFNINPVQQVINDYKEKGYGTNQETLEVGMPSDIILKDPPCLRFIDTRVRYNKLHFFVYFRSWDLYGGFPSNLAGLQLLKEHMAGAIGIEPGETIAKSKGLHLYKYTWELAEAIAQKKLPIKYEEEK